MSIVTKHIDGLMLMDWQTLALLAAICGLAAFFIKDYLHNPIMVIFVYPILLLFSIIAQYCISQADLFSPKKFEQWVLWTILASITGTVIGTLVVGSIASLRDRRANRRG